MRTMIMLCVLLSGCSAMVEQQRVQQETWDSMTPEQQMVQLERQRVAIEQQRANTEQIQAGLRMMQSAPPPRLNCISQQIGQLVQTTCN